MADFNRALEWAQRNPNDPRSRKFLEAVASGKISNDSVKAKITLEQANDEASKLKREADLAAQEATFGGTMTRLAKKVTGAVGLDKATDTIASQRARGMVTEEQKQFIPEPTRREKAGAALQVGSLVAPIGTAARLAGGVIGKTAGNILAGAGAGYAMDAGSKLAEGKTGPEAFVPGGGTVAGAIIPGVGPVANALGKGTKTVSRFATAQVTGLKPETIQRIISNPNSLTEAVKNGLDRRSLGESVRKAIEDRIERLSETGKGYEQIRKSTQNVQMPADAVTGVLRKFGIDLDQNGKILVNRESSPLSNGDRSALESFLKDFGIIKNTEGPGFVMRNEGDTFSANAYLNARKALSNLSKYDASKTDFSKNIARTLRAEFDKYGKEQLTGLADLDKKYAPEVELLNKLKKEFFDKDGTLKGSALSRIANLTGKGKEKSLARLEKVVPGIGQRAQLLKAIEDISDAEGQKVGTYVRGALSGGAALTGNIPLAAATFILGTPKVAVPLLQAFGKAVKAKNTLVQSLTGKLENGGLLNQSETKLFRTFMEDKIKGQEAGFKAPGDYLLEKMKKIRPGMNIQDITRSGYKMSEKEWKQLNTSALTEALKDYRKALTSQKGKEDISNFGTIQSKLDDVEAAIKSGKRLSEQGIDYWIKTLKKAGIDMEEYYSLPEAFRMKTK